MLCNLLRSKVMFSMLWHSFSKFSKLLKPAFLSLSFTNNERMTRFFMRKRKHPRRAPIEVLYLQYMQPQQTPRLSSTNTFPNAQCDNTNKSCLTSLLHHGLLLTWTLNMRQMQGKTSDNQVKSEYQMVLFSL